MTLTLTINMDNAAFEDNGPGTEAARILREAAQKLESWPGANEFSISLMDSNGNKVGRCQAED